MKKPDEKRTEREMGIAICSISNEIQFTTETEADLSNNRLTTSSFELWSELNPVWFGPFDTN